VLPQYFAATPLSSRIITHHVRNTHPQYFNCDIVRIAACKARCGRRTKQHVYLAAGGWLQDYMRHFFRQDHRPELDTILNDACAAMMAPCAYRERLPKDQACAQITTWPLAAPVENTQSAKIESTEGSEEGGSKLQCRSDYVSYVVFILTTS
jgi:hypothetical protein